MTTLIAAVWNQNTKKQQSPANRQGQLSTAVGNASRLMSSVAAEAPKDARFLFTAPEYLFTAIDSHFMTEEEKEAVRGGLIALSAQYSTILLMPGSIGWYKTSQRAAATLKRKLPNEKGPKREMSKYLAPYGNFSTTNADFSFARPEIRKYYEKEQSDRQAWQTKSLTKFREALDASREADVRVAKNTCFAMRAGAVINRYDKTFEACDSDDTDLQDIDLEKPYLFMPGGHSPDFVDKNITYGVELCADHNAVALRNWITKVRNPGIEKVDIQVVMSATTGLEQAHCVARHFLIHADSDRGAAVYKADDVEDPIDPVKESNGISVYKLEW